MNNLSDREHAQLARDLIKACGGLDEVIRATGLSRGYLSKYQNANYAETMPARVINILETFCGRPLYSAALFDAIDTPCATGALKDLACDLAEVATGVQALIRKALADGRLSPANSPTSPPPSTKPRRRWSACAAPGVPLKKPRRPDRPDPTHHAPGCSPGPAQE